MSQEFDHHDFGERLHPMIDHAKIEIIPSDKILERIDLIPKNSELSVTASPTKEIEETLDLSGKLIEKGYEVIPHIAARRIRNFNQLRNVNAFLENYGVSEVFVIGGDGEPFGDYSNSFALLEDLLPMNKSIKEIGVGGYPEGHPKIDDITLFSYLRSKVALAQMYGVNIHINSQACYDPEDIGNWLQALCENGIYAPVFLGISAPMNLIKLAQTSAEIGVGDSVAFLKMVGIDSALKSAMYSPDPLLQALIGKQGVEQIKGVHLFTFNHIKNSMEWQKNFKI